MSDPPRITDPNGTALPVARDLLHSARSDAPPPGARERALEKLEAALANDDGNNRADGDSSAQGENSGAGDNAQRSSAQTGQRNENSVLFSLASLQNVTGASAPKKHEADSTGSIDLRALSNPNSAANKSATDALLNVGGPMVSPLAAPVLAPVPTPHSVASDAEPKRGGGGNKTVLVAGVLIALILAAGGIGVAFLLKPAAPPATVVVSAPPPPANPGDNANNGTGANAPGTTVADNTNANAAAGADPTGANRNDRTRDPHAREHDTHATASTTAPATATTPPPPANTSGCAQRCRGNIDCLLRCTAGGGAATPPPASSSSSGSGATQESPSRNDVIAAMGRVRSAVVACARGQTGTASVSVTFASSGRVTTSNVGAPFAGTPAGSCMARAVRSASVPAFSRPSFSVTYPFRL